MKHLIISSENVSSSTFDSTNAALVTPRNAVRIQWNQKAIRRWCAENGRPLFIIPSHDTVGKTQRLPNSKELRAISKCREDQTGELVSEVELAEGIPVMVAFRRKKETSLSKGASEIIKHIVLSNDDADADQTGGIVKLKQLPKVIFLQLDHPPPKVIEGPERGEIPVKLPSVRRFRIQPDKTRKESTVTITQEQYGLVAAFAFTDYQAQGQTIDSVIIDITQRQYRSIQRICRHLASGVDEDLAAEDTRLEELSQSTRARYETRHPST
ncbi:hypothetical protein FRB90_010603 [Tulasnella sp. 427]|nr:hypothetical protein FRB90_010603 [Tulasnella sp. 427]